MKRIIWKTMRYNELLRRMLFIYMFTWTRRALPKTTPNKKVSMHMPIDKTLKRLHLKHRSSSTNMWCLSIFRHQHSNEKKNAVRYVQTKLKTRRT